MLEGSIFSLNISTETGEPKKPVPVITVDDEGIVGDAHRGKWHRQISLLAQEDIEDFAKELGRPLNPGEFAENITTEGVDLKQVTLFDRFEIGDVVLEVTQIGKECHGSSCAIFREVGRCIMPTVGLFTRVIKGGLIKRGSPVKVVKIPLRFEVITLSDRAFAGEYEDKSGPRLDSMLTAKYLDSPQRIETHRQVLPDEPEALKSAIVAACDAGVDVIITTGSTGIGPRDMAPDVVCGLADKTIPGIMQAIRVKYGKDNAKALLSRSVAAVRGKTLIYTLPGSVKAVQEYMPEIFRTLQHAVYMLHGIDVHAKP